MKKITLQEKENLSRLLLSPQKSNVVLGFEILKNYPDISSTWNKELVLIWQLHDEYVLKTQASTILKQTNTQQQLNEWANGFKIFSEIPKVTKYTDKVRELLEAHENIRAQYQTLMEFNPHFCLHYYTLAETLHLDYKKHFDLAEVYYRIVLKTNPNHKDNLFDLARLLSRSPDSRQEAIKLYLQVAQLNPKSAMTMNNIGVIYANNEEFEKAYKYFKKGLAIDASHTLTMSNLSRLCAFDLQEQQYKDEAKIIFKKLTEMEAYNGTHWNNWATHLWLADQNYDQAKKIYTKGLTHSPKEPMLLGNLGELYIDIYKEYDKGLNLYRKALEIEVSSYRLITTISTLVHHTNKHEEAIKYYKKLIKILPDNKIAKDTSCSEKQWEDFLAAEKILLDKQGNIPNAKI